MSSLRLFTTMWAQVWSLQLAKEARLLAAVGVQEVGVAQLAMVALLALAVCDAAWRSEGAARLAVVGALYCAFRGSSSNHILLQTITSLAVLECSKQQDMTVALRSGSRTVLAAVYFVTALAKCNSDWIDLHQSCAVLYTVAGGVEIGIDRWSPLILRALPYAAVAGEFGLSLALSVCGMLGRRAQLGLVVTAALFHVGLATPRPPLSVYPFSMLMAPLFALAVGDDEEHDLPLALTAAGVGLVGSAVFFELQSEASFEYPPYGSWRLGLAWTVCAFGLLIWRTYESTRRGLRREARKKPAYVWGAPLATTTVLVVGALPYLGVRTHPTFAMFSNLRLETKSNHFWVKSTNIPTVKVTATSLASVASMNVNLGPWIAENTQRALQAAGASTDFFISPPAQHWPPKGWPTTEIIMEPFEVHFLELRRRISTSLGSQRTPQAFYVDYYNQTTRRRFERFANGSLSAESDAELALPLGRLESIRLRFRAFDSNRSPCRH